MTGDCDAAFENWFFPPEADADQEQLLREVCETDPIEGFVLEPPTDETNGSATQYDQDAVEVPFTFTRGGEREHDNLDVIKFVGKYLIFRE